MNHTVKHLSYVFLFVIFSFNCKNQVLGQDKVNISAGFGIPEAMNIGVHYQIYQVQLGFNIGSFPTTNFNVLAISGDVIYHCIGSSDLSKRRPWYVRNGLNYFREETEFKIDKYLFFSSRVGRELNITNKFGIAIDAGLMVQLADEQIEKKPSNSWDIDIDVLVLPSASISLFFKI